MFRRCQKIILFVLLALLVMGCDATDELGSDAVPHTAIDIDVNMLERSRQTPMDITAFDITHSQAIFSDIGVHIWAYAYGREPAELKAIRLDSPQDPLNLMLENGTDMPFTWVVKLFYNYEEVAFRIRGSEEYITELLVTIEGGERFDIPIYLDVPLEPKETVSKLTLAAFHNIETFAFEEDFGWPRQGFVINLEINYGADEPLALLAEAFEVERFPAPGTAFIVNQQFELKDTDELGGYIIHLPEPLIQVSSGERIELAFNVNLRGNVNEPLTDMLLISLLGWQQIPMSGQPFLWLPVDDEDDMHQGHFYIEAPMAPGFYDFEAFAVHNPTSPLSWSNYFSLEMITRFTILVVED